MVAVNATFTLPGLAGLVLMLGMAVDANVLIYERLREERDRGASLAAGHPQRLRPGLPDHHRHPPVEHLHRHRALRRRQRSAQGLRHQPDGRPDHQPVHVAVHDAARSSTSGWPRAGCTKLSMLRLLRQARHRLHGHPQLHVHGHASSLTVLGHRPVHRPAARRPEHRLRRRHGLRRQADRGRSTIERAARAARRRAARRSWPEASTVKESSRRDGLTATCYYVSPTATRAPRRSPLGQRADRRDATQGARGNRSQKRAGELPDCVGRADLPQRRSRQGSERAGKSRYFTVRTSEKEPELVQAMLDRLLRTERRRAAHEQGLHEVRSRSTTKRGYRLTLLRRPKATRSRRRLAQLRQVAVPARADARPSASSRRRTCPFDVRHRRRRPHDRRRQVSRSCCSSSRPSCTAEQTRQAVEQVLRDDRARVRGPAAAGAPGELRQPARRRDPARAPCTPSWRAGWPSCCTSGSASATGRSAWPPSSAWSTTCSSRSGVIAAVPLHLRHLPWLANALLIQDFKIDLPAVAALLTLVGYSVNDTIVVFDRIREVRGKNPDLTPQMINDSVNQTLSRTRADRR